jgi:hypothetical protein
VLFTTQGESREQPQATLPGWRAVPSPVSVTPFFEGADFLQSPYKTLTFPLQSCPIIILRSPPDPR